MRLANGRIHQAWKSASNPPIIWKTPSSLIPPPSLLDGASYLGIHRFWPRGICLDNQAPIFGRIGIVSGNLKSSQHLTPRASFTYYIQAVIVPLRLVVAATRNAARDCLQLITFSQDGSRCFSLAGLEGLIEDITWSDHLCLCKPESSRGGITRNPVFVKTMNHD